MRNALAALTLLAACGGGSSVPPSPPDGGGPSPDGGDSIDANLGGGDAIDASGGQPMEAGGGQPTDVAPPTEPPDVKAELISAYCTDKVSCCAQAQVPFDPARCRENLHARAGFNAAAAQACLAELRSAVPRPWFWCRSVDAVDLHVCAQVFGWSPGDKAVGAPCARDQECAPSAEGRVVCRGDFPDNQNARCAVVVRGKAGDGPCERYYREGAPARFFECDFHEGFYCESATDTCQKLRPLGAACSRGGTSCNRDGYCDDTERMCLARLPEGSPCCEGSCRDRCVLGTYCEPQTMACTRLKPLGAACSTFNCASGLCLDGKCAPQDSDPTKICAQLAGP